MKFTKDFDSDVLHCGRIDLPWHTVFQDLEPYLDEQEHNESILGNHTYHDDAAALQNEYLRYGYNPHNTRIWKTNTYQPKLDFDWEEQIRQQMPWLDHAVVGVHRQDPGQVLPWHLDRFFMLRRLYPDDSRPIWRFLMFMENWKIGHVLQVNDTVLHHWAQGDLVVWKPGVMHLAANVGLEKKWTCAITGFVNQ